MNPFINLNKRSISLPPGCKDLIDVLNRPKLTNQNHNRRFINLILMRAHQDGATELVIGVPPADRADFSIKYKVANSWYDFAPFSAKIRQDVVKELQNMAGLAGGTFPLDGVVSVQLTKTRLRWKIRMTAPDAECQLTRLDD